MRARSPARFEYAAEQIEGFTQVGHFRRLAASKWAWADHLLRGWNTTAPAAC